MTTTNPLVGALLAAAALLLVVLLCRWTFSTTHRPATPDPRRAALGGDYGLLRPAVTVDARGTAVDLRERLAAAGLRATVAPDGLGGFAVLVFPDDLHRAREVVASSR